MADNTTLNTGTGGDVIASDDITGVKYQRVKITLGADGVNDGDVASGNALPVTGTITAVTAITNALPAGTNNIGDVDVLTLPSIPAGNNNIGDVDIASIAAGDNNIGNVDIVSLPSTPAGTNYIGKVRLTDGTLDVTLVDETGVSAVDSLPITGGTPHDSVDSGNPIKVGGVAVSGSATPTSVATGDRTRFIANQHGIPYVIAGHPNLITREYDFGTAAQTDVNLAAAVVAADERIYITRLEVLADSANTVNVSARVGFGTANVPAASATGVSGMIASHPGIAPGSGIICGNGSGVIAVGGAGEEPRITTSAATTGNTHVIISYFLIDETP